MIMSTPNPSTMRAVVFAASAFALALPQSPRSSSGLSSLNQYRLPERGARIARREERAYRRYVSDEQRREAGRPARQAVVIRRGQATSAATVAIPTYRVDPFWPKPLPNHWILGAVAGLAVDGK